MTAFDDDPEYEAQLKDALGDELSTWQASTSQDRAEDFGDFVNEADNQSEDGVLEDLQTFRMKLPPDTTMERRIAGDEEEASVDENVEDTALSEDARSVSTGDDSPSVLVHWTWTTFDIGI
jgi:hypothetical protein